MENERLSERKGYGRRLLLFGLTCVLLSITFFLPDLLTTKKSLLQKSGQLIYSDLVIDEVSSKNRIGVESKSKRATLIFMLEGQSQLFRLAENIGKDYDHIEYKKLLERLRAAQQVVVWIESSDEKIHEPKIFQVDIDDKTYLDFVTVKYKNIWIFACLMSIGLASMTVVLYKEYPEKFKIFRS
jgi:hypothetical protein